VGSEILENLKSAVLEYDSRGASSWARKAMEEKIDPIKALDVLTETIREVGDGFGKGELFLPELIGAADAMLSATPIIEEELNKKGGKKESVGTVVMGTVFGDIHNIGKLMVCMLLTADGFEVIDLGVDVPAERFIETVRKHKPDILGMSALLTPFVSEQQKVINMLKEEGLRDKVKIMVGGGAINEAIAESIGADGYDPTAPGAAKLARRLIGK
jgi:corrinoid protein of di/trimethylamine methyltransferase